MKTEFEGRTRRLAGALPAVAVLMFPLFRIPLSAFLIIFSLSAFPLSAFHILQ
jgi:hypothetical protein